MLDYEQAALICLLSEVAVRRVPDGTDLSTTHQTTESDGGRDPDDLRQWRSCPNLSAWALQRSSVLEIQTKNHDHWSTACLIKLLMRLLTKQID